MAISGPGANKLAISGAGVSRVFELTAGPDVSISGLTITKGSALDQGGGILNQGSNLSLSGDVLSHNVVVSSAATQRGRGGAIDNLAGSLNITDSRITDNQALGGQQLYGEGGGVFNQDGNVMIDTSTIARNVARGRIPPVVPAVAEQVDCSTMRGAVPCRRLSFHRQRGDGRQWRRLGGRGRYRQLR